MSKLFDKMYAVNILTQLLLYIWLDIGGTKILSAVKIATLFRNEHDWERGVLDTWDACKLGVAYSFESSKV